MELLDYERDHLARVRAGLAECMVLLKKDGAFPLKKAGTLAAYGGGVRNTVKGGTGSGEVNSRFFVSVEQGLREAGFTLLGDDWRDHYDEARAEARAEFYKEIRRQARAAHANPVVYAMGAAMPEPEFEYPLDYSADAAIYVVSRISGEGSDRLAEPGDVFLTHSEIRDILALNGKYDRFMLILNAGGPVDLTPVREVGNILVLSQLGVETGRALADVLLGKAVPSGKLTTTWAAWGDYCPDITAGSAEDTLYREGVYVGYRYYETVGKRAMFPFGFGLSYTEFTLDEPKTDVNGSFVSVTVGVKNVGIFPGKEVVQVYVTAPEGKLKKPASELAGFAKTELLAPGEGQTVTICFDLADLASFDEAEHAYILEAGEYIVRVGTSSADHVPAAVLALERDVVLQRVRPILPAADLEECVYERAARDEDLSTLPRFPIDADSFSGRETTYDEEPPVEPEIAALSDEELAYLAVGHFTKKNALLSVIGNAASLVAGAAGETTSRLTDKGIEPLVMADGPAGLRLSKEYYEDAKGAHAVGGVTLPESMLEMLSRPARAFASLLLNKKPPRSAEIKTQYCTAIPIGTAIAQSWNLDYARECGDIVGAEMERFGVHLWLAPALNIHRSILCGRNFEYYSEDPLLSGRMAAAITQGVQAHPGKGTTIKHFAANNQEYNRYFNNSVMSERTLREIYLKGFAVCVREAQPHALMTSYNLLNGTHTSESRGLIEDYLRAENGFEGIVMSDWVMDMPNLGGRHRIALSHRASAAGEDLFMPGGAKDHENILNALRDGELTRHQLEVNGSRVLRMIRRLTAENRNA